MNLGTASGIQTTENDLQAKLGQVHQYSSLTASNLIELLRNLIRVFTDFFCQLQNTGNYGWAFIWHTDAEWILLPGITAQVVRPTQPGIPANNNFLQAHQYAESVQEWKDYETLLKFA